MTVFREGKTLGNIKSHTTKLRPGQNPPPPKGSKPVPPPNPPKIKS